MTKNFIMKAVEKEGGSIRYASYSLKNDIEVVMKAVENNKKTRPSRTRS